jgi:hypothetical protein
MAFRCATGLDVVLADRNPDGLSISGRVAPTLYDRVKAIFPETIIFFILSLNESQFLAFAEYSLASGVTFDGSMILSTPGGLSLRAGAAG